MTHGILTRDTYWSTGTYGFLEVEGLELWTAEQPWRENKKSRSCIPEGLYTVSRYVSPSRGECFVLTGRGVNIHDEGDGLRWGILFHSANWPDELKGCIAPGTLRKDMPTGGRVWPGSLGVSGSGEAMSQMLSKLPDVWTLDIVSRSAPWVAPSE